MCNEHVKQTQQKKKKNDRYDMVGSMFGRDLSLSLSSLHLKNKNMNLARDTNRSRRPEMNSINIAISRAD